jgi:hypothetical protein
MRRNIIVNDFTNHQINHATLLQLYCSRFGPKVPGSSNKADCSSAPLAREYSDGPRPPIQECRNGQVVALAGDPGVLAMRVNVCFVPVPGEGHNFESAKAALVTHHTGTITARAGRGEALTRNRLVEQLGSVLLRASRFRAWQPIPNSHPALRRLRSLRSMWGLRLRNLLLRSLRNVA